MVTLFPRVLFGDGRRRFGPEVLAREGLFVFAAVSLVVERAGDGGEPFGVYLLAIGVDVPQRVQFARRGIPEGIRGERQPIG